MSVKDELIIKYFKLCTNLPAGNIEEISTELKNKSSNPMVLKKKLAFELTKIYHGEREAKKAEAEFINVFQKGERISNLKEVRISKSILPKSYAQIAERSDSTKSVSEAIRLAKNKGLKCNGEPIADPIKKVGSFDKDETVIDIGKRKSVRIVWT